METIRFNLAAVPTLTVRGVPVTSDLNRLQGVEVHVPDGWDRNSVSTLLREALVDAWYGNSPERRREAEAKFGACTIEVRYSIDFDRWTVLHGRREIGTATVDDLYAVAAIVGGTHRGVPVLAGAR